MPRGPSSTYSTRGHLIMGYNVMGSPGLMHWPGARSGTGAGMDTSTDATLLTSIGS